MLFSPQAAANADAATARATRRRRGMTAAQHTEQSPALMPMHPVQPDRFRAVMGHFATGVAVVTATGPEGPVGMTANAVCSLSLDPLLLLVCFANGARTLRVVRDTERFGVNVLEAHQEALAHRFASKLPEREKFSGIPHGLHEGIPVLEDSLAWVRCAL